MNWKKLAVIGIGVLMLATTTAPAAQRLPSPEKTRKKVLELTAKLESQPLSKKAKDWRKEVLTYISNSPDLKVQSCRAVLGELLLVKRLEAQHLYVQLEISTAAYLAEHPEAAADREGALVAGLNGVLRTYTAMHRTNPSIEIPMVDELIARQGRDEIDDYVREALTDCGRMP